MPKPLDHCVMVDMKRVSTRARKPLPKLNHHFHAVLIGRSAPFLREIMFRHVEFDVHWNGSDRRSIARATCTFSMHTVHMGYIRMAKRDESKREA